jgi:hypothetical protein
MIFTGGGGSLPIPNTPAEWLGLALVILVVVWLIRQWFEQD